MIELGRAGLSPEELTQVFLRTTKESNALTAN
jgi:hypothetical protein